MVVRDKIFWRFEQHLGENAASAKLALLTGAGAFTGMNVPLVLNDNNGYGGRSCRTIQMRTVRYASVVLNRAELAKQFNISRARVSQTLDPAKPRSV